MKRREKTNFGLTGEMAESELLGEVGPKINIDFKKWLKNSNELYQPMNKARQTVRENQPGDPRDPNPKFANDVFEGIIAKLLETSGLENSTENYFNTVKKVRFYTAVHSPLDYAHGVDAFFEIDLDDDNMVYIDLDASTHGKTKMRANVLINYPAGGLDPEEDKKEWEKLVAVTTASILESFNTKIKNHDIKRKQPQD